MTIVGAGNLSHDALLAASEKAFGNAPSQSKNLDIPNKEKPYFTASTLYMRDDEMANLNIGVFFDAPDAKHPDYFAMKLFGKVMGEY